MVPGYRNGSSKYMAKAAQEHSIWNKWSRDLRSVCTRQMMPLTTNVIIVHPLPLLCQPLFLACHLSRSVNCMSEWLSSQFTSRQRLSQQSWPRLLHHDRHNQTEANGGAGRGRAKLIESQTLLGPRGLSFFVCMERAECSIFKGRFQIRQMTWIHLQRRWSLLVQHSAWCWMPEEQLGMSLKNRPADDLQLCWELPFLNIHIFNQLKQLSLPSATVQKKKGKKRKNTLTGACKDTNYAGKLCAVSLQGKYLVYDCLIQQTLFSIRALLILNWAAFHWFMWPYFLCNMRKWLDCELPYFILYFYFTVTRHLQVFSPLSWLSRQSSYFHDTRDGAFKSHQTLLRLIY